MFSLSDVSRPTVTPFAEALRTEGHAALTVDPQAARIVTNVRLKIA
jgi:hypothetical protein